MTDETITATDVTEAPTATAAPETAAAADVPATETAAAADVDVPAATPATASVVSTIVGDIKAEAIKVLGMVAQVPAELRHLYSELEAVLVKHI